MAWVKTLPADATVFRVADDAIRANNAQLETALDNQHVFTTAGAQLATHRPGVCNVLFYGTTVEIAAALIDGTHPLVHDSIIFDTDLKKFFTSDGAGALVALELSGSGIANAVVDEDDMVSNLDTKVPTQQSVKAFVTSGTVTMTNKTLTSPVINTSILGAAVGGAIDSDGTLAANSDTAVPTQKAVKTALAALATATFTPETYAGGESVALGNGLIIKFGVTAAAGPTIETTFGAAFPTGVISALITNKVTPGGNYYSAQVTALTLSKLTTYHPNSIALYWLVIGY
jgi:hypothetical protein